MTSKDNYDILAADIVFLAETLLTSHDNTEKYSITNFNAYKLDQHGSSKPNHGLIVYVHKDSQVMDITLFPGAAHRRNMHHYQKVLYYVYHYWEFTLVLKQSQINSMLCYLNVCHTATVDL